MKRVRKAVIPVAGLGTRFLPVTKTVPKELLPIVDKPILLFIVEEAVRAGIEEIIFVQGRGKTAIEDFFDTAFELEATLAKSNKLHLLKEIETVREKIKVISIRQQYALGLGHAVYAARPAVGDEPFALLLGDELMFPVPGFPSAIGQLCEHFAKQRTSIVSVMEVAACDVSKYGIVAVEEKQPGLWKILDVIEKPRLEEAPSRFALPGRYIFDAKIFEYLANTKPGKNGEIQLTDSMTELAKNEGLLATQVQGRRFDAGDKLGYLQANIEAGLEHPELGERFKNYLQDLVRGWS
jgi:UTP--glucose-1-phosphate uridylyltransferase